MVDTLKKVGIITQARMTSTRLPGKIMLPVNGLPILKYHIDRLRQSGMAIYLATTTNSTDDVIEEFGRNENIPVHRGNENNVLSRYYETAIRFGLDVIVRVTSDCPLIDGELIKQAVDEYLLLNNPKIYLSNVTTRTFPRGFDFEIFSFQALKNAYEHASTAPEFEHVTPYIRSHADIREVSSIENNSRYRITLDTIEDLELIKILIEQYNAHKLNHLGIIEIMKLFPELEKINAHIEQKKIE